MKQDGFTFEQKPFIGEHSFTIKSFALCQEAFPKQVVQTKQ
jgi:hypothetical protein